MARWLFPVFLLTLLLAAGVGAWQWGYLTTPFSITELTDIGEELLPGPLRGPLNQPGKNLTTAGILAETNRHRALDALPALTPNSILDQAAQKKVTDMFARQYFAHEAPDGTGPADLVEGVHYEYIRVGENLALGNFPSDEALVQAWMDSPGHRANILHTGFSEVGLAVGKGNFEGTDVWLAVQTFAAPLSSCPAVDPTLQKKFDQLKTELDQLSQQLQQEQDSLAAEQAELGRLAKETEKMAQSANDKVVAGNAKIQQGNQIYQDTGDREQAQPYWDDGKQLQSEGEALLAQATAQQKEYAKRADELARDSSLFNQQVQKQRALNEDMTATTTQLNQQIRAFNDCIK